MMGIARSRREPREPDYAYFRLYGGMPQSACCVVRSADVRQVGGENCRALKAVVCTLLVVRQSGLSI
jgi:hypothetical protein